MEKPVGLLTPGCRRTWQQAGCGWNGGNREYEFATLLIVIAGVHFRHF
jgi:hypothetical protein